MQNRSTLKNYSYETHILHIGNTFFLKDKKIKYFDSSMIIFSARLRNYNTKRVTEYYYCKYCKKEKINSYNN